MSFEGARVPAAAHERLGGPFAGDHEQFGSWAGIISTCQAHLAGWSAADDATGGFCAVGEKLPLKES